MGKKEKLSSDLGMAVMGIPVGFITGTVRSWVDPFSVFKELKHVRDKGINRIQDYSCHLFGVLGYSMGVYNIFSRIAEDPKNVASYVPIAVNAVSAGLQVGLWAYNKGKRDGLAERVEQ